MRFNIRRGSLLTRRRMLATAAATGAAALVDGVARPYLSRAADRPLISHGLQSGDVSTDSGVVWARADRPSRMQVEIATSDSFRTIRDGVFVDALPDSDFTAKALIENLPAGQDIFYRVRFQDLSDPSIFSEPAVGRFRTKLPNGEVWKNLVTEAKSKPAESLAEFRGNYQYNLLDANLRAFNAEVPMFAQWDDHEVTNNWWPGEPLTRAEHQRRKYVDRNVLLLAARAGRAFHEYMPIRVTQAEPGRVYRKISYGPLLDVFMLDMRSYRGPNAENNQDVYGPDAYFLGPRQVAWLKRELLNSRATWKVISADMPIGLIVVYDGDRRWGSEGIAQGDGPALGRELEIADILSFIKHAGVRNTLWLTADVHYTAAHYYDPNRAMFQDFEPFWEFVSGPIHAGSFGPNRLDNTFGPQLRYVKAPTREQGPNTAPTFGLQFFGHVAIDGATEVMTVTLKDRDDQALWSTTLEPRTN